MKCERCSVEMGEGENSKEFYNGICFRCSKFFESLQAIDKFIEDKFAQFHKVYVPL